MNADPFVSIVLPTYNGAKYIGQSIESCLNQTYKNLELIIVDDHSTDNTPSIVKSYKDIRIKYVRHDTNKRLPEALNSGFTRAGGDYLTWTSDDNYYAKDAIGRMVSFLENDLNCDFVYCDFWKIKGTEFNLVRLPEILELKKRNDIGACFLYRKKLLYTVGAYDRDAFLAEDYDYWIRVSKQHDMKHLAQPLYYYREHEKALSLEKYHEVKLASILVLLRNNLISVFDAVRGMMNYKFKQGSFWTKLRKLWYGILVLTHCGITLVKLSHNRISVADCLKRLKYV